MILALLFACATPRSDAPVAMEAVAASPVSEPPAVATPPAAAEALPAVVPGADTVPSPQGGTREPGALCKERVEGASTPGECATAADCARAGCSQEVCVPATAAGDVMTTCEILPCFQMLDTCGCHEGVCAWTFREPAPRPLPPSLPR